MSGTPSSSATPRWDLAATFEEYPIEEANAGFIATRVAPVVEVAEQTADAGKLPLEALLPAGDGSDTRRAPGSGYARGTYEWLTWTYSTEEHGAEEAVDDRRSRMFKTYLDAEAVAARRALDRVIRNAEMRMAALVFNATTWTGASLTTAVTNEWDDAANATPQGDVEGAIQKVRDNSGLRANALILGWKAFRNLRLVAAIQDDLKYSGIDDPKFPIDTVAEMLAEYFALDMVLVGGAPKNTAKQGQSASLSDIWSTEYAMIARIATGDDPSEACIARTFHWSDDGSTIGGTVENYREEQTRANVVRVRHDIDEVVMYTEAGHLLSNIIT